MYKIKKKMKFLSDYSIVFIHYLSKSIKMLKKYIKKRTCFSQKVGSDEKLTINNGYFWRLVLIIEIFKLLFLKVTQLISQSRIRYNFDFVNQ